MFTRPCYHTCSGAAILRGRAPSEELRNGPIMWHSRRSMRASCLFFAALMTVACITEETAPPSGAKLSTQCSTVCDANARCSADGKACVCNAGYAGNGQVCTAIDVCAIGNGGCAENATCTAKDFMATCVCKPGYAGDGKQCTDVDECTTNNGGCNVNAVCANLPGGRTCSCNAGYVGDGVTCTARFKKVAEFSGVTLPPLQDFNAAVVGSTMYLVGRGAGAPQIRFRRLDLNSFALSTEMNATEDLFNNAGYLATIVSDGVSMYSFGNSAFRYDSATSTWIPLSGYTLDLQRGEAASVFDPMRSSIRLFGGRTRATDNSTNSLVYSPGSGFSLEDTMQPKPLDRSRAHFFQDAIYVAGGSGAKRFWRKRGAMAWEVLDDVPNVTGLFGDHQMGHFGKMVWVSGLLFNTATLKPKIEMQFFAVDQNRWTNALTLTTDADAASTFVTNAGDDVLMFRSLSSPNRVELYRLLP